MRAGSNLIKRILEVSGTQCSVNIHTHIEDTTKYSLGTLPAPQIDATPLKFGPNQLEAVHEAKKHAGAMQKYVDCLA